MAGAASRKKIAILGGGVGAMTAAYELTEAPDWREHYEITVYQLGWRLGGKGASGRNRAINDRIEEHGLHLWFGYYENAFNLMQRAYGALGRPAGAPLATWQDAFHKHSLFVITEFQAARWSQWNLSPWENDEVPGDGTVPPLWELLDRVLAAMQRQLETALPAGALSALNADRSHPGWLTRFVQRIGLEISHAASGVAGLHAARAQLQILAKDPHAGHERSFLDDIIAAISHFLETARSVIEGLLESLVAGDPALKRVLSLLELGFYIVKGVIVDDIIHRGFEAINHLDLREWLAGHGAGALVLDSDALRIAYESIFAYEKGSYLFPNLAAGVGLQGILRLSFSYKGAFAWKMQAGMGDTVFGPLYLVLRDRGVDFRFFHNVREIIPSADGSRIAGLTIGRQATPLRADYDPLYDVKGLACWPNTPIFEQLQEGPQLEAQKINLESFWADWPDVETLHLVDGQDFDEVVLGISVAALPMICPQILAQKTDWREMQTHVQAVQTQAFQIWTTPDVESLGWTLRDGAGPDARIIPPIFGGFAQPHNTIADMSHLLAREAWPASGPPGACFYFCGPLRDPRDNPQPTDRNFETLENFAVNVRASQWLRTNMQFLMPLSVSKGYPDGFPDTFDFGLLYDHTDPQAEDVNRLDSQFWRVNADPTERYVLSLKGTIQHRLAPDGSGYDNLKLAGDWTRGGLNYGCVENAVMSGMTAARSICGYPKIIFGENYPKP